MILGQTTTILDNKKRISLPAKFRGYFQSDESVIISRGFEGCLVIRNLKEFAKWQDKILQQSEGLKESRILSRQIFANSEKIVVDSKYRITIPSFLLDISEISKKVTIIGMINKLEVWAEEKWNVFDQETKNKLEEVVVTLKEF